MGLACSDAKIYRTGDTKQRKWMMLFRNPSVTLKNTARALNEEIESANSMAWPTSW
jgi:hypothetical protein